MVQSIVIVLFFLGASAFGIATALLILKIIKKILNEIKNMRKKRRFWKMLVGNWENIEGTVVRRDKVTRESYDLDKDVGLIFDMYKSLSDALKRYRNDMREIGYRIEAIEKAKKKR